MRLLSKLLTILLFLISFTLNAANGIQFIKNKGQWTTPILYKATLNNGAMFIEKDGFTYNFYNANEVNLHPYNHTNTDEPLPRLRFHAFKMNFIHSNPNVSVSSKYASTEYYNYILGNDKSKWKSHVKAYSFIEYSNLYPNINLQLYSSGSNIKYDIIIQPKGKIKDIKFNYEGVDKIQIDKIGNLHIATSVNEVIEQKPYAYQIIDEEKIEVPCQFILKENQVSFKITNDYNKDLPLIIDPVLIFAAQSGSIADNFGMTATPGSDGSLYSGGTAFNIGYRTTLGAYDTTSNPNGSRYGVTDAVITKYSPDGSQLIYSTYIGGGTDSIGTETVQSMIANGNDELYFYGVTSSEDFPMLTNSYDSSFNGGAFVGFYNNGTYFYNNGTDIYVAKLSADGSQLLASTYIGGSENDGINYNISNPSSYTYLKHNYGDQFRGEIMLDKDDDCYIASTTLSNDFPTTINSYKDTISGEQDGVIFKLDANLSNLLWSTYIGGNDKDACYSLKVDSNEVVYASGGTVSTDFPITPGSINTAYQGGVTDGFLVKLNNTGDSLLASTFLGTNGYDQSYFIELDRFGSVYTVGQTDRTFPVINSTYSSAGSSFILKLNNDLDSILYSTTFGNGNLGVNYSPSAFLVDRCQNVYVSGWGGDILTGPAMTNMPTTSNAFRPNSPNGFDFFLFVLERDAQSQLYGTYFGGIASAEHVDGGTSRFDKNGVVYQSVCAGCGRNQDFPVTPGAWPTTAPFYDGRVNYSNNCNNGVFKFDFEIEPKALFTTDNFQGCAPLTITFTNSSVNGSTHLWNFGNGDTTSVEFNPTRTYTTPGVYNVSLLITDSICNTVDTAFQTITVFAPIAITGADTIYSCDSTLLSVSTTGGPNSFIWSSNNQFSDTINSNLSDSTLLVFTPDSSWYYVRAFSNNCSNIDSFLVLNKVPISKLKDTANCLLQDISLSINNLSNTPIYYSWTPTLSIISGANSPTPLVNPDTTTTYHVLITAQNDSSCTNTDSITVFVPNTNQDSINVWSDKDTLFDGEGTYLHILPNNGYTYQWIPPHSVDNPTSSDPFATPLTTTTYNLVLTEISSGCAFSERVTVYVYESICGEPDVFIPNAFTPNADGENDVLYVRGNNVKKMILKIYDRWGELVFETDKQNKGWDGTYKGELVEPAVFVYYLTVTCIDKQEYFKKGNITVIR